MVALHIFLSPLVAILRMDTIQLDVTTAFLYADIDETIYVEPPRDLGVILRCLRAGSYEPSARGIITRELIQLERGGKLLLKKSLYGLKQSPKNWHKTIDAFLTSI